jgi:hypothetical protein
MYWNPQAHAGIDNAESLSDEYLLLRLFRLRNHFDLKVRNFLWYIFVNYCFKIKSALLGFFVMSLPPPNQEFL